MSILGKYWKALLAFVLLIAAAVGYLFLYRPALREYEEQRDSLDLQIVLARQSAAEDLKYAAVQELLPEAEKEIRESWKELYDKFPIEMREEDQILYILELEKRFGTEISFSFGQTEYLDTLSGGASLLGLTLTINYETTYQGFKDMVEYLATDSRITSVRYADMSYDAESDTLTGTVTIMRYLIDERYLFGDAEYEEPYVTPPDTGKETIFD